MPAASSPVDRAAAYLECHRESISGNTWSSYIRVENIEEVKVLCMWLGIL